MSVTDLAEPRIHNLLNRTVKAGQISLDKLLRNGNLLDPSLVELPEEPGVLHHPLNLPTTYSSAFYNAAIKSRKLQIAIAMAYTPIAIVLSLTVEALGPPMLAMAALCGSCLVYLYLDYRIAFLHREILAERARYYAWLFKQAPPYLIAVSVFFTGSGFIQFVMSDNQFLNHYGMLLATPESELWRIVTGSLIHARPAHWLTNFSVGVAVAVLCGPALRLLIVPVFLIGGIVSFLLTLLWVNQVGYQNTGGLVGTSGGLAALLGAGLMLTVRYQGSYPKGFYLNITFFLVVSTILGAYFSNPISLACHVTGVTAGATMALAIPDYLQSQPHLGDPQARLR